MDTTVTLRRQDLVPLSELEVETLRLWTDRNVNFWQHRPQPPAEIISLRERFFAAGGTGQPPGDPPAAVTVMPNGDWSNRWTELLRLDVRFGVIVLAIVVGVALSVTALAAIAFVP